MLWCRVHCRCRAGLARADRGEDPYMAPRFTMGDGYNESFNGSLSDELLNGEIFYSLAEAKVLIVTDRLRPPALL